jgi:hydrogenase maturation protein HypF
VAAGFHRAVARMIAGVVAAVAPGAAVVGLTGGVMQNAVLARAAVALLEDGGRTVLTHRKVPPNDGGLALGQVAVAAAQVAAQE